MPRVSIIIPTYNASKFIEETLQSIANQTIQDFECIIVNDGSTDSTASKINEFNDSRFRVISINNSGGPSIPRNKGLDIAIGDYIFFFDSDDIMHPEKLELSVRALEEHRSANFLFTNFSSINESGQTLEENFLKNYDTLWRILPAGKKSTQDIIGSGEIYVSLLSANFIGTSSVAIRRISLGVRDKFNEVMKNADDYLFWVKFLKKNDAIFINRPLHKYRIVKGSISNRGFLKRAPSILIALFEILEECDSHTLRKKVKRRISIIYKTMAYAYYKDSKYSEQIECSKKSMKYKFSLVALKYYLAGIFFRLIRR